MALSFFCTGPSVLQGLRQRSRRRQRPTQRCPRPLMLEPLEERMLLTGTWAKLTNPALSPDGIGTMMLLTDGTVLAQSGGSNAATRAWYKLTPDATGSYVNGTWSSVASGNLERLYFGSNVLQDGRVFVVGGEYSGPNSAQNFTNTGEIYDPVANTWTNISSFPRSMYGDDPTMVLPDGRVLAGYLLGPETYIYDPATDAWTQTGTKLSNDNSDEETWVKLPNNNVLSYDVCVNHPMGCNSGAAQRYNPTTETWVSAGTSPVQLSSQAIGYELGPALLIPDGRVFFLGGNSNTAYYNPGTNNWTAGPTIPLGQGADDAPAAMLPNGKILLAVDHPLFFPPMTLYEFDPATNQYTNVTPNRKFFSNNTPAYRSRMLMLPTGQVLVSNGSSHLAVYTPDGSPDPSWQPTISQIADNGDGTFTLTGTQLNGLSAGACYGDDVEMDSNYPIVRITATNGHVYYARTFNWDNTGVATGSTPVSTHFKLPAGVTPGTVYNVEVVANGIASEPLAYNFVGTGPILNLVPSDNPVMAGVPFNVTVRVLDANLKDDAGFRDTIHFSSSDGAAALPDDYTFTAADGGEHTFTVTLNTNDVQTITADDITAGALTGTTAVIVTGGQLLSGNQLGAAAVPPAPVQGVAGNAGGQTGNGTTNTAGTAVPDRPAQPPAQPALVAATDSAGEPELDLFFGQVGTGLEWLA